LFKRNRKLRQMEKNRNKLRSLLRFQLKNCIGVPFNDVGRDKVHYHTMLAMNHFLKKNRYWAMVTKENKIEN
jgi:hypothetical protein